MNTNRLINAFPLQLISSFARFIKNEHQELRNEWMNSTKTNLTFFQEKPILKKQRQQGKLFHSLFSLNTGSFCSHSHF